MVMGKLKWNGKFAFGKENISIRHYKILKNGCHFVNMLIWKNFKLLSPPKVCLWFSECQWKWNISIGHCDKCKITNPPKFDSLVYPMSHLCVVLHLLIFSIVMESFIQIRVNRIWSL